MWQTQGHQKCTTAYSEARPSDSRLEGDPGGVGAGPPHCSLRPLMLGSSRRVCPVAEGVFWDRNATRQGGPAKPALS